MDNTDIGISVPVLLPNLLNLEAGVIGASATATCVDNATQLSGSSELTDVTLDVLGSSVVVDANPAPNTVLVNSFDGLHGEAGACEHIGDEATLCRVVLDNEDGGIRRVAHAFGTRLGVPFSRCWRRNRATVPCGVRD